MVTSLTLADYGRLASRASALTGVDHPGVMRQLETFIGTALVDRSGDDGDDSGIGDDADFDVIYSVAEWVPGRPLGDAVAGAGPAVAIGWVAQVARALSYLHQFRGPGAPGGIIHRDVKPSNIRITPEGTAVLIDFGIARPRGGPDLTDGAGTYLWRAPEVIGGPGMPGAASDAWAVGALAYWVLVGDPPRLDAAAVAQSTLVHAARVAGFPRPTELGRHIARLLESHPDDRPGDLSRWADGLEAVAAGDVGPSRWRRPVPALAAAVLVVAIGAAVVPALAGHRGADRSLESVGTVTTGPSAVTDRSAQGTDPTTAVPGPSTTRPAPATVSSVSSTTTGAPTGTAAPPASTGAAARPPAHRTRSSGSTKHPAGSTTLQPHPPTHQNAPTTTTRPTTTTTRPKPVTYAETTGGPSHTWTDYLDAGGREGPTIRSGRTVQISCVVHGYEVADGNTWWYRIASAPWNNAFYVSADAFYNDGATSGSLLGTPFVDPAVPAC
jgi:serine/threonine protein kinase